jgi:hypothetical protein
MKTDDVLETLETADLAVQLEALEVETKAGSSSAAAAAAAASGGGGKKKKKQKITLMSTGGRRGF